MIQAQISLHVAGCARATSWLREALANTDTQTPSQATFTDTIATMSGRGKRASTPGSRASPAPRKSTGGKSSASAGMPSLKAVLLAVALAFAAIIYGLDHIKVRRSNGQSWRRGDSGADPHHRAQARFYIFDPAELHKITQASVARHANDTGAIFDSILEALHGNPRYTASLNKRSYKVEDEWMLNNAGGEWGPR